MDSEAIEKKLSAARTRLILDKPFLGALVLRLPMVEGDPSWCKTTATDARKFYYNAEYINNLTLDEAQFILAHEALHCALSHFARRSHRIKHRWDLACDYAINPLLIADGLKPPFGALHEKSYEGMSAEEIYPYIQDNPDEETMDQHLYDKDQESDGQGESNNTQQKPDQQESQEGGQGDQSEEQEQQQGGGQGEQQQEPEEQEQGQGGGQDEQPEEPEEQEEGQGGGQDEQSQDQEPEEGEGQSGSQGQQQTEEPEEQEGQGGDQGEQQPEEPEEQEGQGGEPSESDDQGSDNGPEAEEEPNRNGAPQPAPLSETEKENLQVQWQQRMAGAAQQAQQAGKLGDSMARLVDFLLQPQLPWRMLLARYMSNIARDDYSYSRPSSRREGPAIFPSLRSDEINLVVAVDVSGSVTDKELGEFASEVNAIKSQMRARINLLACDAELAEGCPWSFEPWEDFHLPEAIAGGGGTSFVPVFDWAGQQDQAPDLLVYFTDAEGEFPAQEPAYPVIWLVKGKAPVPFGQRIQLN